MGSDDPHSRNELNSWFWVTKIQMVRRISRKFVAINNHNVSCFLVKLHLTVLSIQIA